MIPSVSTHKNIFQKRLLLYWRHDTQHNDIQHNDTQHEGIIGDIQHTDIQHNDAHHNIALPLCRVSHFIYYYAECHYAECRYAECCSAALLTMEEGFSRTSYDNPTIIIRTAGTGRENVGQFCYIQN